MGNVLFSGLVRSQGGVDWLSFGLDVGATLIGAAVGFGLAMAGNRWAERTRADKERKLVLRAYDEAVRANRTLLGQIRDLLGRNPTAVLTLSLDVGRLDALRVRAAKVMTDLKLLQDLQNFQYQLEHLGRKLDTHLQFNFSAATQRWDFHQANQALVNTILKHAQDLEEDVDKRLLRQLSGREVEAAEAEAE